MIGICTSLAGSPLSWLVSTSAGELTMRMPEEAASGNERAKRDGRSQSA